MPVFWTSITVAQQTSSDGFQFPGLEPVFNKVNNMDHRETYIIFSPGGRTGSHMILEAISGMTTIPGGLCNAACYWHPKNPISYELYDQSKNIVIHTHNLNSTITELNLNSKDITLILSYRRDLFLQVMSSLVAELTTEWSGKDYSDKEISPVFVSKEKFKNKLLTCQKHLIPNINEYKKVVTIFYEDIVSGGAEYIASILDVEYIETQVGKIHRKSPYSYKDWIVNWQELYNEFCKL